METRGPKPTPRAFRLITVLRFLSIVLTKIPISFIVVVGDGIRRLMSNGKYNTKRMFTNSGRYEYRSIVKEETKRVRRAEDRNLGRAAERGEEE